MKIERKLQEISGSLLITVPKEWANSFHLKKGSKTEINIAKNGTLIISPKPIKELGKEQISFQYDENFIRNFFLYYFQGYEKIVVEFAEKTPKDQEKIYSILKKFMNVQIIEENKNKISFKCFKIDELSILECLNRMYFLSHNMFEELLNKNNKPVLEEIEISLTKFYYMLVMQVRRFIDEGKFTEQNQISLLYALDCRMVAEKIKRMGEVIQTMKAIKNKNIQKSLEDILAFYKNCFWGFYNRNYDTSLNLFKDFKIISESLTKLETNFGKEKKIEELQQIYSLKQFLDHGKSIMMLTR
ncbi:MAG: hypothetical protein AABW48_06290 [Nanoarchaeota archaeon]